jgi:hypothetical protein
MSETTSNRLYGFDIADLTHESEAKRLASEASHFLETSKKSRLFLISKDSHVIARPSKQAKSRNPKKKHNRKKIIFNELFTHNGKNYRVNSAKSGLYAEILIKLIEQFELASQKWGRVFVLRFDLHSHYYTGDNKRITAFRKRLFQRLKREYGFNQIGFGWVREMERSKAQHYHWVLFLDGNLIRHSSRINQMIKDAWEDVTGAYHVPVIPRPFYFGNTEAIAQDAIYRISYLAKARGKGYRDKQAKDYQTSRMK